MWLIKDTVNVDRTCKTGTALRNTTNRTCFNSQSHLVTDAFFVCNCRNEFRNTDTEVNNNIVFQFHSCTTCNDLLSVKLWSFERSERNTEITCHRTVIILFVNLCVVIAFCDNNAVYVNARDLNHSWVKAAVGNNFFYLNEHFTAVILCTLCKRSSVKSTALFFKSNVAGFVSICTADENNIQWLRFEEKFFFAFNFN